MSSYGLRRAHVLSHSPTSIIRIYTTGGKQIFHKTGELAYYFEAHVNRQIHHQPEFLLVEMATIVLMCGG